jgi:uncharacterized DUF497 family protein
MRLFEWDPAKDAANRRKHGVGFEVAMAVFDDPFELTEYDLFEGGEHRWRTTGVTEGSMILMVAYTWKLDPEGHDIIRIISARPAEPRERRQYQRGRTGPHIL